MSRRLKQPLDRGEAVRVFLDGAPVRGYSSETVAVALFAGDKRVLSRSLKYHRPRSFFCLEGHCGGCLMRIGGIPNLRACMHACSDGLEVEGQNAYPSPDLDVLEAVDWLFPRGMNHHTLMTGSRILNKVVNKVVRQLSGLGTLPDAPPDTIPEVRDRDVDVAIIGGGPAGLAAARAAATAGATTLLLDEHAMPGGCLATDPRYGLADASRRADAARAAGAELLASCAAIAFYPEDGDGVLPVATPTGLLRVTARRYVYATGGYASNLLFPNNDRPGILAARAVGRLLVTYGIKPGNKIVVIGADDYATALVHALDKAGSEIVQIDDVERKVTGAHGRSWVTGVETVTPDGKERRIDCDLVAVSTPPAPATDGLRQHGCVVELRPKAGGFAAVVDADGHTNVADVLACGDVCGFVGVEAATRAGAHTGAIAAAEATS